RLANSEQTLLRPHRDRDVVPLRTTDRAEQDAGRRLARLDRRRRQRTAGLVVGDAADQGVLELEAQLEALRHRLEDTDGRGRDLGTDAVAAEHDDLRRHACVFSYWLIAASCSSRKPS